MIFPLGNQGFTANADSCDNSGAKSEYNGCKTSASQEKNSCIESCKWYLQDPCYGECQSNYNQCSGECNSSYNTAISGCSETYNSQLCSNNDNDNSNENPPPNNQSSKEPKNCNGEQNNLDAAHKKVAEACKGINYPERLLTDKGQEPNDMMDSLCKSLDEQVARDQATLDRAQKLLDWDKSEKRFFEETVIPNIKEGHEKLLDDYEKLEKDIEEKKELLDKSSEHFSEIKAESTQAWIEAIAGAGGPAGLFLDVGILIGRLSKGSPVKHIGIRVGIDAAEHPVEKGLEKIGEILFGETTHMGLGLNKVPETLLGHVEFSPLSFVGIAYDGLELQELKNLTADAEKDYNQKLSWYEDALTAMNGFKNRDDYAKLMGMEKKLEEINQKIRLLDIEINSLEKQIPVMKHTLGISKELSDKCQKDKQNEANTVAQQERCRSALKEEQTAKSKLKECEAAK